MEDQTDVVQPDQGQGDTGSDSPYSQYLEQIPEEARDAATQAFKDWDANYTRKSQEHAEYRKSWEPYEQAGINQYDPQALAQHLQMLQDPAATVEWARAFAQQNGLELAPQTEQPPEFQFDQTGFQDLTQQQVDQLLEQRLGPVQQQIQQFQQWQAQQEEERRAAYGQQLLDEQFAEIRKKNPDANIDEETRDWIERKAEKYVQSDPDHCVLRAWDDLTKLLNTAEKQALQKKVDNPAPAEGGGVADVSPEKFKSLQDDGLAAMASQILRNGNRA